MNTHRKIRILTIAVLLLSLIILSLAFTLGYSYYRHLHSETVPADTIQQQQRYDRQARYMARKLELSPEQEQFLRNTRITYHRKYIGYNAQIDSLTNRILNEIASSDVDTVKLNALIDSTGELFKAQGRTMVGFLLAIKGHCSPRQQQNFIRMMRRMPRFGRTGSRRYRYRNHSRGRMRYGTRRPGSNNRYQ